MSNHVTEWLNAYLDGELHGSQLQHVEAHLVECDTCRVELDSLEKLSAILRNVPAAEFSPRNGLQLKSAYACLAKKQKPPRKKILEIGWWMIPIGLLAIWIVINASFLVYDVVSVANRFGLLTSISDWMRFGTSSPANWSSILGQIGVLRGNAFALAASTETFTRTSLLQINLQVSVAMLYLSWIAIWWARHQRQENGQLLKG